MAAKKRKFKEAVERLKRVIRGEKRLKFDERRLPRIAAIMTKCKSINEMLKILKRVPKAYQDWCLLVAAGRHPNRLLAGRIVDGLCRKGRYDLIVEQIIRPRKKIYLADEREKEFLESLKLLKPLSREYYSRILRELVLKLESSRLRSIAFNILLQEGKAEDIIEVAKAFPSNYYLEKVMNILPKFSESEQKKIRDSIRKVILDNFRKRPELLELIDKETAEKMAKKTLEEAIAKGKFEDYTVDLAKFCKITNRMVIKILKVIMERNFFDARIAEEILYQELKRRRLLGAYRIYSPRYTSHAKRFIYNVLLLLGKIDVKKMESDREYRKQIKKIVRNRVPKSIAKYFGLDKI